MKDLQPEIISAIIGVGGTLCGTVLGWLLAKIDCGRVHIVIEDFQPYITYMRNDASGIDILSSIETTFTIKLYNSSSKNRVLRDFCVVCLDKKNKQLYKDVPRDKDTASTKLSHGESKYIDVINIQENSGLDIHAGCKISKKDEFLKTQKIYLYYKTGSMKQRKKLVVCKDFSYIQKQREVPING